MSLELGRQDVEILKLLQTDCTISTASIAERINMSQSPCWRRINRMEQEGLFRGRVALLNSRALGMDVVVFATINLTSTGRQNLEEFEQEIVKYPEVMECYTMTGIVRNTLTASPSIRELHSHMAVTEIKNSTELPLETQLR
jgi:Lrp/AsnC family transcriptional regulator